MCYAANVPASISVSLNRQQHVPTTADAAVEANKPTTTSKHLLLSSTASALARIRMSLMAYKPASHAIVSIATTTILLVISIILLSSVITIALALPNSLVPSNFNGAFTGWVNQCVQAKLANNNNNNSSVSRAIANPTFALANARAYCTQLLQGYINSNNQLATQNQPTLSTTDPPTYPYQYQNPAQYPYQQQQPSQTANTPPQYPYQQQQQPQQQPQSSQSYPAGQPSVSTLIIVTHVNSTGGSKNNTNPPPANFTQVVENAFTNPDGYTYIYHYTRGSETGVSISLQPGSFDVYELSNNNNNVKTNNPTAGLIQSSHSITYSGDCRTVKSNVGGGTSYGHGIINPGETKTCTVTLSSHK